MNRRPILPGRHRRLAAATVLATLAVATGVAPASAIVPATPSISAWVVARQKSAVNVPYTPGPKDQGNSMGGTNKVIRTAVGTYTVQLGKLDNPYGQVQLTPLGVKPIWCTADEWNTYAPVGSDPGGVSVVVTCRGANKALTSAKFALVYTVGQGTHGGTNKRLAYVHSPQASGTITPPTAYQYSSSGSTLGVQWTATGRYTVTIPSMGVSGGNVQVGAYQGVATCAAVSWKVVGTDKVIKVACRAIAGNLVDVGINLLFTKDSGPAGIGNRPAAYLFANRPKAASYQPIATYRYNSSGKPITVMRASKGNYTVVLTGMPAGGAAFVTPAGSGNAHCQLSSLGSVVPMKAIVRCYTPAGALTDSPFSLAYTR